MKRLSTHSFGPEKRLRKRWQFLEFMGKSQVQRLSDCVIYSIPNREGYFRLGITLKARGTSIERNRVKRAIRESFRTHPQELGSRDYNVVIPVKQKMDHIFARRLKTTLVNHLQKASDP